MTRNEIHDILDAHEAWVRGDGGRQANFRGANLSCTKKLRCANLARAVFTDMDLRSADLTGACLEGARFIRSDLSDADLSHALLAGAHLSHCVLVEADLTGAELPRARIFQTNFYAAILTGANFFRAEMEETNFEGACLNWNSHDLLCALLEPCAAGDLERERWVSWIRFRQDLCWDDFARTIPAEVLDWGFSCLVPYLRVGDGAPKLLKRYRRRKRIGRWIGKN